MTSDDYVMSIICRNFFVNVMKYKEHQCLVLFFYIEIALPAKTSHLCCEKFQISYMDSVRTKSHVMKRTKNSGKTSQNITVKLHRLCLPKLQ